MKKRRRHREKRLRPKHGRKWITVERRIPGNARENTNFWFGFFVGMNLLLILIGTIRLAVAS